MTRRRFWLLVHRTNGLLLAGFLTIVGVTGSILVCKQPLERLLAPALFRLPPHSAQEQRIDPLVARERVAAAFPQAQVDMLDLTAEPDAPWELQIAPRRGAPAQVPDDVFVDPYNGRILGSRRYGALREGKKNIVPFVYDLHEDLALGEAGAFCLGVVALVWTVDCFVGLYLTFPASRRSVEPSWFVRALYWPRRFLPSWCVRWTEIGFRRLYDLHRAPGLWLWPLMLLFAWTGVAFDLPVVYNAAIRVAGAAQPAPLPVCVGGSVDEPEWGPALALARGTMGRQLAARAATLRHERFLSYDPAHCAFTYRVLSSLDVDTLGNTQIIWGLHTPSRFAFSSTTGTRADTFTIWLEAVHEAQVGGMVVRVLVAVAGLGLAALSVTGVLIFLRKVRG